MLTPSTAIAPQRFAKLRFIGAVLACAAVMMFDGYDLAAMPLAVPHIANEWQMTPASFGLALSSVLLGLGAGALFLGSLGDRFGRRPVVILSLLLLGSVTLGTASSASTVALVAWRLATGLCLGACLPNVTALVSELAPPGRRAALLTIVSCGVSVGMICAGLIAPILLPIGGWQALFVAPGLATFFLCLLFFILAPESPEFLAERGKKSRADLVCARYGLPSPEPSTFRTEIRGTSFSALIGTYRRATIAFVFLYTVNALVVYMLSSWLPTVLMQAGFTADQAARLTSVQAMGGLVGALIISWFLDKGHAARALFIGYALVLVSLIALSATAADRALWGGFLLVVGAGTTGMQLVIMALGTSFYPARVLSSAIGLAVALARIGAIGGSMAGSLVVGAAHPTSLFFLALTIPIAICCAGLLLLPGSRNPAKTSPLEPRLES